MGHFTGELIGSRREHENGVKLSPVSVIFQDGVRRVKLSLGSLAQYRFTIEMELLIVADLNWGNS